MSGGFRSKSARFEIHIGQIQMVVTGAMICARMSYIVIYLGATAYFLYEAVTQLMDKKYEQKTWVYVSVPLYFLFSILWLWSYFVLCWGDPGSLEKFYDKLGVLDDINSGQIPPEFADLPRCSRCALPKPLRCHHCSVCNQCHFRFDHHCPVLGNCVALYNHRAFIMMPTWGGVLVICLAMIIMFRYLVIIAVIVGAIAIGFFVMPCAYCNNLVCQNRTTLEEIIDPNSTEYSNGCRSNFKEIYGCGWSILLPLRPPVTGFHWCGETFEKRVLELMKNKT